MRKPGMQKPHCTANWSTKACCSGWSSPSAVARPSIVVTAAPWARAAGTRQDRTATPSRCTVQAPHSPSAQPSLVPVRPTSSRSQSSSVTPAPPADRHRRAVDRALDGRRVVVASPARRRRRGRAPPGTEGPPRNTGRPGHRLRSRPSRSGHEGAADHLRDLLRPVGRRGADVVDRGDARGGQDRRVRDGPVVERPPDQALLGRGRAHHRRRHAAEGQAGPCHRAHPGPSPSRPTTTRQVHHGDGLGPALAELHEQPTLAGGQHRHLDGDDQLARLDHRAPQAA